jgi:hypothetical protein
MKTKCLSLIAISLLALDTVWLAGCASTVSPRLKSESSSPPCGLSIVLVRLTASMDGKPANPFAGKTEVGFSITNLETGTLQGVVRPVPVGDAGFARDGWAYLLLAPGGYRLTAEPLGSGQEVDNPNPYRLFVPVGRSLLYAGSLQVTNNAQISLKFEPEAAQTIAQTEFKAAGSLTMAQLQPVDAFASTRSLSQLGDLVIVTSSSETLEQPHWISRAAGDYVEAAMIPPDPFGFIFACDLAAMPVAALAGTIAGTISQKQWAAGVPGLRQVFEDFHPATEFAAALFQQAQSNGLTCVRIPEAVQNLPAPGTTNAGAHVLRGDLRKIRLVQGAKRGLVGTEATLRFRILDAQGNNCLYDQEFQVKSEFKNKKEYRGTPGRALFSTQLVGLINSGVEQFFNCVTRPPTAENQAELPTKL